MLTPSLDSSVSAAPTEPDARLALEASRRLAHYLGNGAAPRWQLIEEGKPDTALPLPAPALRLLARILTEMAQGNGVTLLPVHADVNPLEAAGLLNVSPPFLLRLLEEGKLPFHTVGAQRRIRVTDLLAYKTEDDQRRLQVLEELSALDQELKLGY